MIVVTGGKRMTDGKMTIQVTEEEYEHIMKLRAEMERRKAAGDKVDGLPGGRKSAEFGMGAVAGIAAYWLYNELVDEDDDDDDEDAEVEVVHEVRAVGVVRSDPRKRRRRRL